MGVDLVDWYRGQVSFRRLVLCSMMLNDKSFTMRILRRREEELTDQDPWDEQMSVAVATLNTLQGISYLTELSLWAQQKKPKESDKPKPPDPIRPPGWKPPKPKMATAAEGRQFLQEMMNARNAK